MLYAALGKGVCQMKLKYQSKVTVACLTTSSMPQVTAPATHEKGRILGGELEAGS